MLYKNIKFGNTSKNRYGGNGIDNAEVLCQKCDEATHSLGTPGYSTPEFTEETRKKA